MDYDFRNSAQYPLYRTASSSMPQSPMYGHSVYPKVAAQPHTSAARPSPYHLTAHPPTSSSGLGVRVALKPEYRIPPPKFLAEAEKESQNWSRLAMENLPSRTTEPTQSGRGGDPVSKYIVSGLSPEAVSLAVANYGNTPVKEMGLSSSSVVEALVTYDNDTEKALAHFLDGPS